MILKTCSKCLKDKQLVQFSHNKLGKDGRRSTCKECDLKRSRVWKAKKRLSFNPEEVDREICKVCSICQEKKNGHSYYLDSSTKDGLQTLCIDCSRKNTARWQKEGKYGLSPGDYERMFVKQEGLCGICGTNNPGLNNKGKIGDFCIDHNHDTKKVRGLLCYACNKGIGHLRDDPILLKKAVHWLENVRWDI